MCAQTWNLKPRLKFVDDPGRRLAPVGRELVEPGPKSSRLEGMIDHQRLAGAGYCFSASCPPAACSAASAVLADLSTEGGAWERLGA